MRLYSDCVGCLVNRQMNNIKKFTDENIKTDYMRKVLRVISDFDKDCTAPVILEALNKLYFEYFGESISFEEVKKDYNLLMLKNEEEFESKVKASADPLKTALTYCLTANYIDFGAVKNVNADTLFELFENAGSFEPDLKTYEKFKNDLNSAKSLVILHDNCGEAVLDKILIKTIKSLYPTLKISSVVRGTAVLNDVTLKDAEFIGLTDLVPVYGNGTGIPGTQLNRIRPEARNLIENADVIISKGQGNFETISGSGLNIYYLFLCKCDNFVRIFNTEKNAGMFINEKDLNI